MHRSHKGQIWQIQGYSDCIIAFVSKSVPSDICSAKPMCDFVLKELCFSNAQFLLNSSSIEPFTWSSLSIWWTKLYSSFQPKSNVT